MLYWFKSIEDPRKRFDTPAKVRSRARGIDCSLPDQFSDISRIGDISILYGVSCIQGTIGCIIRQCFLVIIDVLFLKRKQVVDLGERGADDGCYEYQCKINTKC